MQSQQRDRYEYQPLPEGRYIRYLILEPGTGNDPIVCTIESTQLDKAPPYEAISYVWGSPTRDITITCYSKELLITENLRLALCRLRLPTTTRTLWADSICINQDDLTERGHQVEFMSAIYSTAAQVLAYLGPEDSGAAADALSLVTEVSNMVKASFDRIRLEWDTFPDMDESDPILSDPRWNSFSEVICRPWFRRGWVVQEVSVASRATLLFGGVDIPWEDLAWTAWWLEGRGTRIKVDIPRAFPAILIYPFVLQHLLKAQTFGIGFHDHPPSFLDLLTLAKFCQLTDPRDRVYAFLSLEKRWPCRTVPLDLTPNYRQDFLTVYHDFAIECIKQARGVEILEQVIHDEDTIEGHTCSWVPRWDRLPDAASILYMHKSRLWPEDVASPLPFLTADGTLCVRGILHDSIAFVSRFPAAPLAIENVSQTYREISAHQGLASRYTADARVYAFVDTLAGGAGWGSEKVWFSVRAAYIRRLQACGLELDAEVASRLDSNSDLDKTFEDIAVHQVRKRALVVTARGYFGLAPGIAQVGDICGIAFGARAPMVVRSTAKAGHYKLVGHVQIAMGGGIDQLSKTFGKVDLDELTVEHQDIYLV